MVLRGSWRLVGGVELYNIASDPGQHRDVAAAHPQVVAALRQDYDDWWREMQRHFAETVAIPIGAAQENPTLLSARDWHPTAGAVPWRQAWIDDRARDANGYWLVEVVEAGVYRFELRTHPREADRPLSACVARLQIGDKSMQSRLSAGDCAASFECALRRGICKLQTWLDDADGRQRGAYTVYVDKLAS